MKLTLRHLQILSDVRYGAKFLEGAAQLVGRDKRVGRILSAAADFSQGLDSLADLLLAKRRIQTRTYDDVAVLRSGVMRFGREVCVINAGYANSTHVWQLGDHVVMWHGDDSNTRLRTSSPLPDLAADVLDCYLADIGSGTRAVLRARGLEADGDKAPSVASPEIEDLLAALRRELPYEHRSVLLYGPAGAGKTAASRYLVEHLVDSALVVSSELLDGNKLSSTDPFEMIVQWRPKAVILDDVDRALVHGDAWLLAGLTRLRAVVPLIIATANVTDDFSGGLLRPERFDRRLHVMQLHPDVSRRMLPHTPTDVAQRAIEAGLHAAYLRELNFRCKTGDDPQATLAEMIERQAMAGDGLHGVGVAARGLA